MQLGCAYERFYPGFCGSYVISRHAKGEGKGGGVAIPASPTARGGDVDNVQISRFHSLVEMKCVTIDH